MNRLIDKTIILSGTWNGIIIENKIKKIIQCELVSNYINKIGQIEGYGFINEKPMKFTGIFGLDKNRIHLFDGYYIYHLNLDFKNSKLKGLFSKGNMELYKVSEN